MMRGALVLVLVAFAFFNSPVSTQDTAQSTQDNNSNNRYSSPPSVLNLDYYLLQLNSKLDRMDTKLEEIDSRLVAHQHIIGGSLHEIKKVTQQLEQLLDTCGGIGWRRVVYLDMTDNTTTCPSGWQLTAYSKRTCGRATTGSLTCDSAIFPVSGGPYTRVCGRIKAYQYYRTDAFEAYHRGDMTTIDGAHVAGVSLTHRSPRQYIWTFAAGSGETLSDAVDACPCDASISISIPGFVGTDYFCESGRNTGLTPPFSPDDPLWDGQGCGPSSTCCSFNTPPYFTKQLPTPTTDDIEARICQKDSIDDSPVELIELYVQ